MRTVLTSGEIALTASISVRGAEDEPSPELSAELLEALEKFEAYFVGNKVRFRLRDDGPRQA